MKENPVGEVIDLKTAKLRQGQYDEPGDALRDALDLVQQGKLREIVVVGVMVAEDGKPDHGLVEWGADPGVSLGRVVALLEIAKHCAIEDMNQPDDPDDGEREPVESEQSG